MCVCGVCVWYVCACVCVVAGATPQRLCAERLQNGSTNHCFIFLSELPLHMLEAMCIGTEADSYLRRIDSCIPQLKA